MCGRYVSPDEAAIERAWHLGRGSNNPFARRYNAAPTQMLPVCRVHSNHGLELALLRWGLIPYRAKDTSMAAKMINARCETVAAKPAFRSAFKQRRCLVPMMGFYEWQKNGIRKVPHYIRLLNTEVFAAAGLYEWWPGNEGAEPIESYTIITTDANEMVGKLHDRMPVILHEHDYEAWLDPNNESSEALKALLKPYPAEEMRAHPISTRVNNVKNEDEQLIEEIA
jgi:putative SOS response-associated peptidase YedK